MKKIKWLLLCMALFLLGGCADADTQEQKEVNWQVNEAMIQMIQDAAGCDERRAKAILETFREVELAEPVSAVRAGSGGNDITVETSDGGKYEVKINRKHYVYSIKDLTTGEMLYMVIE